MTSPQLALRRERRLVYKMVKWVRIEASMSLTPHKKCSYCGECSPTGLHDPDCYLGKLLKDYSRLRNRP